MRILPKSLGGQLLALLLVALLAAQIVIIVVFTDDRANAVRQADRSGLIEGIASVTRLLALSPASSREMLADAAGTRRIRYWVSAGSAVPEPSSTDRPVLTALQFEHLFGMPLPEAPRLEFVDSAGEPMNGPPRPGPWHRDGRFPPRPMDQFDVRASVPFDDGTWLNAETTIRADSVSWPWPSTISAGLMALAIFAIVGFTTRRATRPLAALADRAEAFGRGATSTALPEEGPTEVRRLTSAFNRMQDRLGRFIADRTRMLAAIGHDLRTPITSLKLRAELLDDDEARAKMLATLDDMERMSEATLAFAREDAAAEPARSVDLDALIGSLADDLAEMGKEVSFTEGKRVAYPCRPTALRRALNNLVDNAIRYGRRARITLANTPAGPLITIDDDGSGIPEDQLDEVFKPFVRLEQSRSRETGGSGLGLSIARSIILSHGGELTLANRPEGGLRAEVRLPPAPGSG